MAFTSNLKSLTPRRQQFQKKIKLLSGGYIKPDSFPNGEITVFPWDADVDDWLADRIKKGNQALVLYDLCAKVCDLNGCPLDSFLIGDVNTVLLVSRSIRYSSVIEYEAECPICRHRAFETITVPDELGRAGEKTPDYRGYDEIILPDCQDVVQIRPLCVRDERLLSERDEASRMLMTDHVMRILQPVVSINGGKPDAWEEILRWFKAISPRDAAFLEQKEGELYPHLDVSLPHQCDRCGKQFKHDLDFSQEFFRSSLKPVQGNKVSTDVRSGVERKGPDSNTE